MKKIIVIAVIGVCTVYAGEPTAAQKQAFGAAVKIMDQQKNLPAAEEAFVTLKTVDSGSPFVVSGEVEARILAARSQEAIGRADAAECFLLETEADAVWKSSGFSGYGSSAKESILRHRYLLAERSGGGRFQSAFRDYAIQYHSDFLGNPSARKSETFGQKIDCILWAIRKLDSPAKEELIGKLKESISSGADEGVLILAPEILGREILPLYAFEAKKELLLHLVVNVPVTVRSKSMLEFAKGEYLKLKDL